MQWLIDTILEASYNRFGYVRRGDPSAPDWTESDLIQDNAYHLLDLSGIIDEGAVLVLFRVRLRSTAISKFLIIRDYSHLQLWPASMSGTQVASAFFWSDMQSSCDSQRRCVYRVSAPPWTNIDITVAGWFLRWL